jgi:hypothetical protein
MRSGEGDDAIEMQSLVANPSLFEEDLKSLHSSSDDRSHYEEEVEEEDEEEEDGMEGSHHPSRPKHPLRGTNLRLTVNGTSTPSSSSILSHHQPTKRSPLVKQQSSSKPSPPFMKLNGKYGLLPSASSLTVKNFPPRSRSRTTSQLDLREVSIMMISTFSHFHPFVIPSSFVSLDISFVE